MNDLLFAAAALLLLDQQSKRLVVSQTRVTPIAVGSLLQIRHVVGRRTIYASVVARVVLSLLWLAAFVAAVVLKRSGFWFQGHLASVGLGLALGGAAGNLLDILRFHHVVDFIDVVWWPVFNLADVAIIGGLILALGLRA